jgi:hypothetical protein
VTIADRLGTMMPSIRSTRAHLCVISRRVTFFPIEANSIASDLRTVCPNVPKHPHANPERGNTLTRYQGEEEPPRPCRRPMSR